MGAPSPHLSAADSPGAGRLVAREVELAAIEKLVARDPGAPSALILEGEPGVGKTSLWESGVALAGRRGLRVLVARASGAETGMPFTALVDLFDGVSDDELAGLPPPQLRALNVALYRIDPTGPSQAHVIALSVLSALRALSARDPVLVAIDDLQWLDRESEESLAYAARRVDGEAISFLNARRPGRQGVLEGAFAAGRHQYVQVSSVSLGATRQLLAERLQLRLPHHLLRKVYDTTLGNPLFSLEVGRLLQDKDLHTLGDDVPVPDDVEDLLGMRVADLDVVVRRTLLALALDSDLNTSQLDELAGDGAVQAATREGVVLSTGERVRAAHPLLAAAAKRQSTRDERGDVHRALADIVRDEQRRALHLALATSTHDDGLAARVSAAAERAAARGATMMAVELATHALRLTPADSTRYTAHLLGLGQHLSVAGEKQRLTELLADTVESLPRGAPRVVGYLLLTNGVVRDNSDIRRLLERALVEAGDDDELRSPVLSELAENQAVIEVADVAHAVALAEEGLASSGPGFPHHRRAALNALAWTRALGGGPIDDLVDEYEVVSDERYFLARSPQRVAGQRHVWRGEIEPAREILTSLQERAVERAEPSSYALQRLHLCELMLRIGDWHEAQRLLDEWAESTDRELLHWPMYERCRALLAAGRGDADGARRWGGLALARAEATGVRWDWLEARRALGLAALVTRDFHGAAQELGAVWSYTRLQGVLNPGVFPVAPDLVEALVETEATAAARDVTDQLADLAEGQGHPWARVGAQRCAGMVQLSVRGDSITQPVTALEDAASAYQDLGLTFDHARTLLTLGRAERRAKKWGASRDHLQLALSAFDAMGSPGWSGEVRSELSRVGTGRPSQSGRLTPTERRVAQLAVDGLSNKEIARELVVTVNTVEFHLRNTYAKLGVRSRVQLVGQLDSIDADPRP